jgi:hypothetical protein
VSDFDFEIKANDYGEIQPLVATLQEVEVVDGEIVVDGKGNPVWKAIDLTGTTVRIAAKDRETGVKIKTAALTLVDAPKGKVKWAPEKGLGEDPADTAEPGEYDFEFEISGPAGEYLRSVPRAPLEGEETPYYSMRIWADLT